MSCRCAQTLLPERGFSSAKLFPGSDDVVLALKTSEDVTTGAHATFATVFTLGGTVLLHDDLVSSSMKFEGVEFWVAV